MAGRLYDSLSAKFGQDRVFFDVVTLKGGVEFHKEIEKCLSDSGVLLAVMGDRWYQLLESREAQTSEPDFVALELETANSLKVEIVPVLVGQQAKLEFEKFAASKSPLAAFIASRQIREIDEGKDYRTHVDRLIRDVETILGISRQRVIRAIQRVLLVVLACCLGYLTAQVSFWTRYRELPQQAVALGITSIEDRSDPGQGVPPEVIFRKARQEVFISGISCYRTFDTHREVVDEIVSSGKDLYVLIMDPDSADVADMSVRLRKPIGNEIRQVITIIKNNSTLRPDKVHIRLMSRMPTFTAVMVDGDIAAQRQTSTASHSEIRVQTLITHNVQHKGVILAFGPNSTGNVNGFDFYASDIREQWADAAPSEGKVAQLFRSDN